MLVVSYANETPEVGNFILSLQRLNYSYKILPERNKKLGLWLDYTDKVQSYLDFLSTLPENKLVLLCNAYDTLAQRRADLHYKSLTIGVRRVSHRYDYFKLNAYWQGKERPSYEVYPEFGFCLGKVKELLPLLRFMLSKNVPEEIAIGMYVEENPWITLDINSSLVANVTYREFRYIVGKKDGVYYKLTNTKPCFWCAIHGNLDIIRYHYLAKRILTKDFNPIPLSSIGTFWKDKLTVSLNRYSLYIALFLLILLLLLINVQSFAFGHV